MNDCQTGLLHVKHLTDKFKREEGKFYEIRQQLVEAVYHKF